MVHIGFILGNPIQVEMKEERLMDKAWNTFTATGKIDDYLKYCENKEEREVKPDGNKPRGDRDGLKCDANWRV